MPSTKNEVQRNTYLIFVPLLFMALILEIVHLPAFIEEFRPDFTVLIVLYFAMIDPKRVNVGVAWIAGILLDMLTGAPMGLNALSLCIQIYIVIAYFRHFVNFSMWQQCIVILLVNFIVHVALYWFEHLFGSTSSVASFMWPSVITMVIWPFVFYICLIACSITRVSNARGKKDDNEL